MTNAEAVLAIISQQLIVDEAEIKPESHLFDDLAADSLDIVEFVIQFEEAFDIEISDEDAEKWKTVKDVLDYIGKKAK